MFFFGESSVKCTFVEQKEIELFLLLPVSKEPLLYIDLIALSNLRILIFLGDINFLMKGFCIHFKEITSVMAGILIKKQ